MLTAVLTAGSLFENINAPATPGHKSASNLLASPEEALAEAGRECSSLLSAEHGLPPVQTRRRAGTMPSGSPRGNPPALGSGPLSRDGTFSPAPSSTALSLGIKSQAGLRAFESEVAAQEKRREQDGGAGAVNSESAVVGKMNMLKARVQCIRGLPSPCNASL